MIVTIDGPAGAGKSTVARLLAERLGFAFLDTGAMYRAVAFAARRAGVGADDEAALERLLAGLQICVDGGIVAIDGEDVSAQVRTPEVTALVRHFADKAVVRRRLADEQRRYGRSRNLVTEGRDQGTVVFPDAECKFFMTAGEAERARRRQADFARQGRRVELEEVLADQRRRDEQDATRALAPLAPAADAVLVDTSQSDAGAIVDRLERFVRARMERIQKP